MYFKLDVVEPLFYHTRLDATRLAKKVEALACKSSKTIGNFFCYGPIHKSTKSKIRPYYYEIWQAKSREYDKNLFFCGISMNNSFKVDVYNLTLCNFRDNISSLSYDNLLMTHVLIADYIVENVYGISTCLSVGRFNKLSDRLSIQFGNGNYFVKDSDGIIFIDSLNKYASKVMDILCPSLV